MTWQQEAACRGMNPDLFFPSERVDRSATNAARALYAHARTICITCTVRHQCLQQAIQDGDIDYGMFGGLTPTQRKKLRAQGAMCGTASGYRSGCCCPPCRQAWHEHLTRRRRRHA